MHVESVAWAAERKDVLSTFFWLLSLLAYVQFARRRSVLFYLLSLIFFAGGLMSKPMVVTLPFVLLLLDLWPLNRIRGCQTLAADGEITGCQPMPVSRDRKSVV